MSFGGHDPNVSLLHDNPAARILPVQGGGGSKKLGWHSYPITVPLSNANSGITASHISMKRYRDLWKRTLGPNVPSRHKPRTDPHVIVGVINVIENPVYVVAPLRGNRTAALDCTMWAKDIIEQNPRSHVVFMGPLTQGGSNNDGEFIEKQVEALSAMFPGHVLCINGSNCLDGLLLHAIPETSKQIGFGFIPDPDIVYQRSSRRLDQLDVDTLRIPASSHTRADTSESIYTVSFRKPSTVYNPEKEPKSLRLAHDHILSAPPGWVTEIRFDSGSMSGGVSAKPAGPSPPNPKYTEETIVLGANTYRIRVPTPDVMAQWEKGEFTGDEQRLLSDERLKYTEKVYALFLKGLVSHQCDMELETQLDPACGVFRYIMADRYYQQVKAKADGKQVLGRKGEAGPARPLGPKPPGPKPTGPKPTGPTTSGPTTSGPTASGPTASGPTASGPTASGPTASGPTASGPSSSGPSGPSASGPTASGPSASGPEASGPSTSGPSASGPTASGPSASGPTAPSASGPSAPSASGPSASGPAAAPGAPAASGPKAKKPKAAQGVSFKRGTKAKGGRITRRLRSSSSR